MKYFALLFCLLISLTHYESVSDDLMIEAVKNEFRSEENRKRDKYRNPIKTLSFFELKRKIKVLEIIPGRGWYTEIISKYMKGSNNFYVATYKKPSFAQEIITKIQNDFFKYFETNSKEFGEINSLLINENFNIESEQNYLDMILTFRNTHNFLDQGKSEIIFRSIHKALKTGGILGIVQHRANESSDFDYNKGYVKETFLIKHIESLGFELIEKSEINSNLKDTKDYKKGVWALPPRFAEGEKNRSFYKSIGESDRMTLKFVKK